MRKLYLKAAALLVCLLFAGTAVATNNYNVLDTPGPSTSATNLAGGTAGSVEWQSAAGVTGFSAAGTTGQLFSSNGTSVPTWVAQSTLTAGTVTTNANLTGPITSTGNATAVAAQTGTGSTFVMQASPSITTPTITGNTPFTGGNLGIATAVQAGIRTVILGLGTDNTTRGFTVLNGGGNAVVDFYDDRSTTIGGAFRLPAVASSSAATTGTLCWTTGTGNVNVDTTTTCLLSARKYKEGILDLDKGLAAVMQLRPVSYRLKAKYNPEGLGRQVGFIADEVLKVDPRLVSMEDGKGKGKGKGKPEAHAVRYQQMVALLAKAIQEQQKQIEELRQLVAAATSKSP